MLCDEIARGGYSPGDKIPSVRDMAVALGVNPNTVQRALSDLEDAGILVTRRGDGRYVSEDGAIKQKLLDGRIKTACEDFIGAMRDLGLDDGQIVDALAKTMREDGPSEKAV